MTTADKALIHQIHPAKLATDISASIVSVWLLWDHQLGWGLAAMFLPPLVASALVMRYVPLERYRDSRFGLYVRRFMTPATQAVRLAGAVAMSVGAWAHVWWFVVLGLVVIVGAWARGFGRPIG